MASCTSYCSHVSLMSPRLFVTILALSSCDSPIPGNHCIIHHTEHILTQPVLQGSIHKAFPSQTS